MDEGSPLDSEEFPGKRTSFPLNRKRSEMAEASRIAGGSSRFPNGGSCPIRSPRRCKVKRTARIPAGGRLDERRACRRTPVVDRVLSACDASAAEMRLRQVVQPGRALGRRIGRNRWDRGRDSRPLDLRATTGSSVPRCEGGGQGGEEAAPRWSRTGLLGHRPRAGSPALSYHAGVAQVKVDEAQEVRACCTPAPEGVTEGNDLEAVANNQAEG
jgi:hypothetical protein